MQLQKIKGHKIYLIAALGVGIIGILLYAIVNLTHITEFINRI